MENKNRIDSCHEGERSNVNDYSTKEEEEEEEDKKISGSAIYL